MFTVNIFCPKETYKSTTRLKQWAYKFCRWLLSTWWITIREPRINNHRKSNVQNNIIDSESPARLSHYSTHSSGSLFQPLLLLGARLSNNFITWSFLSVASFKARCLSKCLVRAHITTVAFFIMIIHNAPLCTSLHHMLTHLQFTHNFMH